MWRKLARKASMGRDQKDARFAHAVDEVQRRKQPRLSDGKAWKNKENAFYGDDSSVSGAESVTPVVDPNFDGDTSFEKLENGKANGTSSARIDRESGDQVPAAQQKPKEGKEIEQGVLCVNMIVARLYYDFNQSERRLAGIDRFFQKVVFGGCDNTVKVWKFINYNWKMDCFPPLSKHTDWCAMLHGLLILDSRGPPLPVPLKMGKLSFGLTYLICTTPGLMRMVSYYSMQDCELL